MSEENNVNMVQCPFCAEKINVSAKKCRYCGEIVDPALRIVTEMKNESKPAVNIVSGSGVNIVPAGNNFSSAAGAVAPKQRITYILLGIFLGGLGIHNFYAGYSGRGVAQLLISLLVGWLVLPLVAVWIWVIIEVCTVDKDAEGNLFQN
ncbi:MAG: NINE protein [Lentisphaerae bacterium]|nr:NINE protein [Lentisphaerota bacterium]